MNMRTCAAAMCALAATAVTLDAQNGKALAALAQDPACQTPRIAAAGGKMPKGQNTVVLRYLGVSNYELAYRDQVLLFDTRVRAREVPRQDPERPRRPDARVGRPQTDEEKAAMQRLQRRGTGGPRIDAEGTLTYLITFDNGYRIGYTDTAGAITDEQRAAFANIPRTDIGIVAYTGRFNATSQNKESMSIVDAFKPRVVLPSHHEDETGIGAHYDMPIYPLGMAVREKFPDAQTIDPLYLSALCFDTQSREFFVGR